MSFSSSFYTNKSTYKYIKNTLYYINHRLYRLYDSFFYAQINNKFIFCLLFPAAVFSIRYTADTKLGYYVFIADPCLYPDYSHRWIKKKWQNGQKYYLMDNATVADLKAEVYRHQKPIELRKKEEEKKIATAASAAAAATTAAAASSTSSSSSNNNNTPPAAAAAAGAGAGTAGDKKEEEPVLLEYQDINKLLVGCRGRMFKDTDILALAVRSFCKRDPNILIWKD